jgi:hypothetical protein
MRRSRWGRVAGRTRATVSVCVYVSVLFAARGHVLSIRDAQEGAIDALPTLSPPPPLSLLQSTSGPPRQNGLSPSPTSWTSTGQSRTSRSRSRQVRQGRRSSTASSCLPSHTHHTTTLHPVPLTRSRHRNGPHLVPVRDADHPGELQPPQRELRHGDDGNLPPLPHHPLRTREEGGSSSSSSRGSRGSRGNSTAQGKVGGKRFVCMCVRACQRCKGVFSLPTQQAPPLPHTTRSPPRKTNESNVLGGLPRGPTAFVVRRGLFPLPRALSPLSPQARSLTALRSRGGRGCRGCAGSCPSGRRRWRWRGGPGRRGSCWRSR